MGIVTKLAFILLYAFSISSAQAKSVTVMINMNYSSTELVALEEVAQKQGQEVIMIPPRSLIPLAEPMFLKKMALEKRIQELRPNWSSREVRIAIYDFAREGSNYSKDPQLKAALAGDIQEYYEMSKRVDEKEKELGPLHE
ncbi:MAG: hypothetical protein M9962_05365, partial [Oligoflexia bacterium]|nr:hypothetical protein [Oligoflexia bacterium]